MAPSIAKIDKDHYTTLNILSGVTKPLVANAPISPATNGVGNGLREVRIPEKSYGSRKKMRVAMIGAGISGINFFKVAEETLQEVDIICYEKNKDIGGTWLENRYPGCACDIPSVTYQFSWRRKPWTKYYSESREIWEYLKEIEQENSFIDKYVKLQHRVLSTSWTEERGQWELKVVNLVTGEEFEDYVDLIINGGGVLNKWKWPEISGLHDFQGTLLHSACYPEDYDLKGKRVALIGAGSSAVQILPTIYDDASKIYTWVRTPIWIAAGFAQAFAGDNGGNFKYTDEQLQFFLSDDDRYLQYCKMIEDELNQRYSFIINGSPAQKEVREYAESLMREALQGRQDLLEKIMPTDFYVGCRRPTPGNGYLEALVGPKTTTYTSQLQQTTKSGFIDPEGVEHEVDVIICATGFDTSYSPQFPIIIEGKDMGKAWKRTVVPSYLSLGYAEVPNYFLFLGGYGPIAHGSNIPIIEAYTEYVARVITKMQVEDIRSLRPRRKPTEHFLLHAKEYLKRTAWTGPCSSWFKGGKKDGTPAVFPGSRLSFLKLIEEPRYEDYEIQYDVPENTFSFMGNGFHTLENDGSDISWYLGTVKGKHDLSAIREQMDGHKGVQIKHME